jgi:hypothetical protein
MRKSPMAVVLRAHLNRKVYSDPYVSGQWCFEAQALSNPLTDGMSRRQELDRRPCFIHTFMVATLRFNSLASAHLDLPYY